MKITKKIINKDGRITVEPSFNYTSVTFYRIKGDYKQLHPVGSEWEFELIGEETLLDKKDKRGKPMFVQEIKPLRRIENRYINEAKLDRNTLKWTIPVYSGDVIIRYDEVDSVISYSILRYARECYQIAYLKDNMYSKTETLNSYTFGDPKPSWMPDDVYKEIEDIVNSFLKEKQEREEKIRELALKKYSLLEKPASKIPSLEDFVKHGVKIHHLCNYENLYNATSLYYGHEPCLYQINDFIFDLGIKNYDEDFVNYKDINSNLGKIDKKETLDFLRKLALFAATPEHDRNVLPILDIKLPSPEVLIDQNTPFYSEEDRDRLFKEAQDIENEIKKNFKPETIEFNKYGISIVCKSYLISKAEITVSLNDTRGWREVQYYHEDIVRVYAYKKWDISYRFDDSVCEQVKNAIIRKINPTK